MGGVFAWPRRFCGEGAGVVAPGGGEFGRDGGGGAGVYVELPGAGFGCRGGGVWLPGGFVE